MWNLGVCVYLYLFSSFRKPSAANRRAFGGSSPAWRIQIGETRSLPRVLPLRLPGHVGVHRGGDGHHLLPTPERGGKGLHPGLLLPDVALKGIEDPFVLEEVGVGIPLHELGVVHEGVVEG